MKSAEIVAFARCRTCGFQLPILDCDRDFDPDRYHSHGWLGSRALAFVRRSIRNRTTGYPSGELTRTGR